MKTTTIFFLMIVLWQTTLSQVQIIDSLMQLVTHETDDSLKVIHYNDIADAYTYVNADSALFYAHKTYALAEKIGYEIGMGRGKNVEALSYYRQGMYTQADSVYRIALALQKKIQDTMGIALSLNNLGLIYMNTSKYSQAVKYFLEAIKFYKRAGLIRNIPATLANIGVVYYYQGNIDMALKYMIDAVNDLEGNLSKQSVMYRNIGAMYSLQKMMDSAFYYARQSIAIDSAMGNKKGLATNYNNMAEFYGKLNDLDQAALYFFKSLELKKEINDQRGLMFTYHNLGVLYDTIGNYKQALDYYKESMQYAKAINNMETLVNIYYDLSRTYVKLGNTKKALQVYKAYHTFSDSLSSSRYDDKLMEMQAKYDSEKQKEEIKYLHQQHRIEQLKSKKNKIVAIISTMAAIILLLLLYYINRLLKIKKRNNSILQEQNEEINQQKEEITAQKEEIEIHRDQVMEKNEFIEKQNKQINASIVYAQQIQKAVMPGEHLFKKIFGEYLIFNRPKDVVSGDFYWIYESEQYIYLALADCTGHGVPGAFMSLLGITYLNETVKELNTHNPSQMLVHLRKKLIAGLHQEGKKRETKDGLVISLCIIDKSDKMLHFAGAGGDAFLYINEEFIDIRGERETIAIGSQNSAFEVHRLNVKTNDFIYLFSDGYIDQFDKNGAHKFSRKSFLNLIRKSIELPFDDQKVLLENELEKWKGNFEQIDDILIVGVKIQ